MNKKRLWHNAVQNNHGLLPVVMTDKKVDGSLIHTGPVDKQGYSFYLS